MNKTLKLFGGAAIVAGLSLGPQPAAEALTEVTIGTSKSTQLAAQIVVADAKGFFEKAGLDADIKYFPSGGDLMAGFVGGSVEFGSGGSAPTLIMRSRPFPAVVIAKTSDISGAQQIAAKGGIDSLEGLKGMKIGVMAGTSSEALWLSALDDAGLSPADYTPVQLRPSEMVQAMVRGDIAAMSMWEPHVTRARANSDAQVIITGTTNREGGSMSPNRIYGDHAVLFTSEETFANEPEKVKMVLEAFYMADKFIDENTDEAISILAEFFQVSEEQMTDIATANDYTMMLDDKMVEEMNKLANFLKDAGKLQQVIDVKTWIEPGPLSEVAPEMVELGS